MTTATTKRPRRKTRQPDQPERRDPDVVDRPPHPVEESPSNAKKKLFYLAVKEIREGIDPLYRVACKLVLGFDISPENALPILKKWAKRHEPQRKDEYLIATLERARQQLGERGYLNAANPDLTDPSWFAQTFITETGPWREWKNSFWRYDGCRYREVSDSKVRSMIWKHIEEVYKVYRSRRRPPINPATGLPLKLQVSRQLQQNVVSAVRSSAAIDDDLPQRSFISTGETPRLIEVKNGLLNLDFDPTKPLAPLTPVSHTPDWFSPVCLPYQYDPNAVCSHWEEIIAENLQNDQQSIELLQEFFGYTLIATTEGQSALILVGEGGNGKSVLIAGLKAMLGDENISAVPLEDFGRNRFALSTTVGKLVNICNEIGEISPTDEGQLKAYITGDVRTFDRKMKDPITASPTARLVIATNVFPKFKDESKGIWRRLKVVPMNHQVPVNKRISGMDKSEYWRDQGQLPGILNWAIEGLHRLMKNNFVFTDPPKSQEALTSYRTESDSVWGFVNAWGYKEQADAVPIPTEEVYTQYGRWCEATENNPVKKGKFTQRLRKMFPGVVSKSGSVEGKNCRAYYGLARSSPSEPNL